MARTMPRRLGPVRRRGLDQVRLPAGLDLAEGQAEAVRRERRVGDADGNRPPAAFGPSSWRCTAGTPRTTFSHTWRPPSRARQHVIARFSAADPQYWHSHPSRANTARHAASGSARKGTWTKCRRRTTDGASSAIALTVEDRAVRLHDLGLLLEHEHDGSPRGNDRERQFGRVEDEGASHGGECTRCQPGWTGLTSRANHNVVICAARGGVAAMPGVANRGRAGRSAVHPLLHPVALRSRTRLQRLVGSWFRAPMGLVGLWNRTTGGPYDRVFLPSGGAGLELREQMRRLGELRRPLPPDRGERRACASAARTRDPSGARRAGRRGTPADRGRSGRRQDDARQGDRPVDRLLVPPDPVHAGHAPNRHHRRERVQPGAR